jgi:Bacterial alpha-L-rhamnosidase C-terminal domain
VLGVTPAEPGYGTVRVAPRPGAIERLAGAVPTPHGLVRVEVEGGQVRVNSPVPVRFVSLSGEESSASAGRSEFTL